MKKILSLLLVAALFAGCSQKPVEQPSCDLNTTVVYELNTRQFTPEGTFAAAAEELPRLKETGIDIVWVMPLYPIGELERKGSLGSYYAIRDYCDVNPELGTLEDFDAFLARAHELDMKVIIDWVANHTSPDHAWVTEKPADWYYRDEYGKTIVEYDWTDIAKLNYDNMDMRAAMFDCMHFWFERGIDGLRCDVAYQVPEDFWTDAIGRLRAEFGDGLYFLAEGEEPWLHRAGFNATYSWKLHHLLNDMAQGNANADSLAAWLEWDRAEYPGDAMRLSFTSNHDENSWSGTEFERMGDAWKAMTVLAWTLPGSQPLIYTAQEIGYDHRFEFFEKDNVPAWNENQITDFYRSMSALKHEHRALDADAVLVSSKVEGNTFTFRRAKADDWVEVSVLLEAPWTYSISTASDCVARIEPPCWWTGMETPLQLMVYGEGIGLWDVKIEGGQGVKIRNSHAAESPNYQFLDVEIAKDAIPGTYWLVFSKDGETFRKPYEIGEKSAAERSSFSTADAIYLIMPDRFANGDPTNDNMPDMTEQADYEAFFGRHGGDIQGIIDHMDYIADLGMTAIWYNPLLEDNEPESSYHGYACTNYYRIDPRFGSNELFRRAVREGHKRGLKSIMDIVTNHSGDKYWWMGDLPFADWIHQWPEYTHSNCAFSAQNDPYCSEKDRKNMQEGWFDTSMVDMNLDNPYMLQYFKQWAIWWIEWAGLDGLRIDTYPYNEKEPMAEWNKAVRTEYPWINIVGEVWSNNVPQVAYWQADNPNRDGFNSNLPSVMDFCLQSAVCNSINTDTESWDEGITKVYDAIANDVYLNDVSHLMVFPGNHDQDRIGDVVGQNPDKLKLVMTLYGTVRGFPQIYTGDELMVVSRDRSQGHGGLRVEFPENWEENPVMKDVHDYCRTLFQWRKGCKAIHDGRTLHFLTRDNTYAYFRYTDSEAVFVYLNNNAEERAVPWADYEEFTSKRSGMWTDALTGNPVETGNLVVPAKGSLVLELKKYPER